MPAPIKNVTVKLSNGSFVRARYLGRSPDGTNTAVEVWSADAWNLRKIGWYEDVIVIATKDVKDRH